MKTLAWVMAGSALGGGLRYWLSSLLRTGSAFPLGTWTVNVLGSFFIAVLLANEQLRQDPTLSARAFLVTGVLGGFTTYSEFNHETLTLFSEARLKVAGMYLSATLAGCLFAGLLGLLLGRAVFRSG